VKNNGALYSDSNHTPVATGMLGVWFHMVCSYDVCSYDPAALESGWVVTEVGRQHPGRPAPHRYRLVFQERRLRD
jgi:hypothetical protein